MSDLQDSYDQIQELWTKKYEEVGENINFNQLTRDIGKILSKHPKSTHPGEAGNTNTSEIIAALVNNGHLKDLSVKEPWVNSVSTSKGRER